MVKDKRNDGIADYIGVSAPETPKYLLTNNFLTDYFCVSNDFGKSYEYKRFLEDGVLYTEDTVNEKLLQKSFDCFLRRYSGEEIIKEENRRLPENKHFYFPLNQSMLTEGTLTLRHLLYHLQAIGGNFNYELIQDKLAKYVFYDSSGINYLLKILFQTQDEQIKYAHKMPDGETSHFWNMLGNAERNRIKKLGEKLNCDLEIMLSHEFFGKLDFYRRYDYLSTLLTSYVIQYIICRKGANVGILCKGNPQDGRLTSTLHRACCNSYAEIRNVFPDLLQKYYVEAIKEGYAEKSELVLKAAGGTVLVDQLSFEWFVENFLTRRKQRKRIEYEQIKSVFGLKEGEEKPVSVEEFVLCYIDMSSTRKGSVLKKISSVLPTSGKQIEMIFPNSNARNKYFAMSGRLSEFYVRLYLARKERAYDYLDSFIYDLQERYGILLINSSVTDRKKKRLKPNLSAMDFAKNKNAFIDTLDGANCLIKLSDSGYVITLPEMKGDFKLI